MRTFTAPAALVLGIAAAACGRQPPPVDLEAARASLRTADSGYSQTASGKNLEAFVALYEPSATMYPPAEALAQGTEAIRAFAGAFLKDPAFAVRFTPVAVEVAANGDMGYTLNTVDITVTGPDGKPATERIRDFHLWRKQADGRWKVVVDIWNAEPPPPTK
ncbi:MAG: DUF4440 domain-containing protein [Gemmatimonadetes bacterium]|nr:DUF4440 domain-containing protein [Gemmatimonadota bacterium]